MSKEETERNIAQLLKHSFDYAEWDFNALTDIEQSILIDQNRVNNMRNWVEEKLK